MGIEIIIIIKKITNIVHSKSDWTLHKLMK